MSTPMATLQRRILVVEDDDGHRRTLARHLGRSGWDVAVAETGERALGTFARVSPHLILTDIRMPGMSGLELLDQLRQRRVSLPVIVMTAFGDMQAAIDAMKKGAYDYLVKPLDLDRLDQVIQRCERETFIADGAADGDGAATAVHEVNALVGNDERMVEIYKMIGAVAHTRTPVLIRGETGTGKELIARIVHNNASSAGEPFLPVNCTAVPESLLESELFGHMRGSFTGAVADRKGRFELAGTGTIFLDEIGDTTPQFQAKLLRVLQEREFYPVGSEQPRTTHARVIAATHRPIEQMVEDGTFREDLYFRLRVVEIAIPPLRDRRVDVPLLARHFLGKAERELGKQLRIPEEVMGVLLAHDWPGNVRELENAITRAAVMARGGAIVTEHLSLGRRADVAVAEYEEDSLEAVERAHVQRILARMGGNKSRAAEALKISRPRLDRIIEKHGLIVGSL